MAIKDRTIFSAFPEMSDHIHEMKRINSHFAGLSDKYDALEHTIHQMESGNETFTDEQLEELKKRRLKLKDDLFKMLHQAA
jgi:uncharacterized protein YdcH (DUF465 family)